MLFGKQHLINTRVEPGVGKDKSSPTSIYLGRHIIGRSSVSSLSTFYHTSRGPARRSHNLDLSGHKVSLIHPPKNANLVHQTFLTCANHYGEQEAKKAVDKRVHVHVPDFMRASRLT